MPSGLVAVSPHGLAVSSPPSRRGGGGRRGKITGWSRGSARRQTRFLQSVESEVLPAHGAAVTVTVRDCPATADEWLELRREFLRELRAVFPLGHWVTEDQARGVPHLHIAVFRDEPITARDRWEIIRLWCRLARRFGARPVAQHVKPIDNSVGWSRYCAKHAARSVAHYQRQGLPHGWERSGRLWGRWGDWETRTEHTLMNGRALVEFRRLLRRWAIADARDTIRRELRSQVKGKPWRHLTAARGMNSHGLGLVRGARCWVPEATSRALLEAVASTPGCVVIPAASVAGLFPEGTSPSMLARLLDCPLPLPPALE